MAMMYAGEIAPRKFHVKGEKNGRNNQNEFREKEQGFHP